MGNGHGRTLLWAPRFLVLAMYSGAPQSSRDEEPDCWKNALGLRNAGIATTEAR